MQLRESSSASYIVYQNVIKINQSWFLLAIFTGYARMSFEIHLFGTRTGIHPQFMLTVDNGFLANYRFVSNMCVLLYFKLISAYWQQVVIPNGVPAP